MSIDRLPSGKWRARVYLSKKRGKKREVSKTFDSKREAKIWEAQTRADILKGDKRKKISEFSTFQFLVNKYLTAIELRMSPNTYLNYKNKLEAHILDELGPLQINTITIDVIEGFKEDLLYKGLEKENINYILGVVSNVFEFGINRGPQLDIKNPVAGVYRFRIQKKVKPVKFIEDTQPFLETIKDNHYEDFILLLLNTGLRISEACALQVSSFDERSGKLTVNAQFHPYKPREGEPEYKGGFILGSLKSAEPRSIPLNKKMIEILKRNCKGKRPNEFIFEPMRKRDSDLRYIIFKRGKKPQVKKLHVINPRSKGFNDTVLRPLFEASGLHDFTVHNLRDTFATHFYDKTRDLNALRKLLGHKKISTTQIYADIFETKGKEYVDNVVF